MLILVRSPSISSWLGSFLEGDLDWSLKHAEGRFQNLVRVAVVVQALQGKEEKLLPANIGQGQIRNPVVTWMKNTSYGYWVLYNCLSPVRFSGNCWVYSVRHPDVRYEDSGKI